MSIQTRWFAAYGLALLCSFVFATSTARALDPQVRDDAGFFSRQAIDQANDIIKQIKKDHGKDVMVETFATIPSDMQAQYDPANKDQFFENWLTSRAKELGVNGVYVLVCKEPSRAQIGIGKETRQRAFTSADRDQMRDMLLKGFRAKQYDEGLISALNFAREAFDRNMKTSSAAPLPGATPSDGVPSSPQSAQPPIGQAPPVPAPRSKGLFGLGTCLTVAIIAIGLIVVLRIVRRAMTGGRPPGGYPQGGGPYGGYGGGGAPAGGGFGRGFLGGILGGILGGYAQDRWSHGSGGQAQGAPPLPPTSGGGIFDEPSSGSFPSDQGQDFSSSGGDFGGGGDSGGGGGGDSSSGGDF